MKRTQIYLPDLLHAQLSEASKEMGVSLSETLRQAAQKFLQKKEKSQKRIKLADLRNIITKEEIGQKKTNIALNHNDIYDL